MSDAIEKQQFKLISGHPALDFVNTLDFRRRASGPDDLLREYADLVDFVEQAGLLGGEGAASLLDGVTADAGVRVLTASRVLRGAAADVFDARLEGRKPAGGSLAILEASFKKAYQQRVLRFGKARMEWGWGKAEAELPLLQLAQAVAELITSGEVERVRLCEGWECGWLFLDTSKGKQRRWCEMKVCGNRAKAQRHRDAEG